MLIMCIVVNNVVNIRAAFKFKTIRMVKAVTKYILVWVDMFANTKSNLNSVHTMYYSHFICDGSKTGLNQST